MSSSNKSDKITSKLKQYIRTNQDQKAFIIEGYIGNPIYTVTGLSFYNDDQEVSIFLENKGDGQKYNFYIYLPDILSKLDVKEGIYQLYMHLSVSKNDLSQEKFLMLKTKPTTIIDEDNGIVYYPVRLGRFQETEIEGLRPINIEQNTLSLYKSIKGNLSLAVNQEINQKFETHIEKMKCKKDFLRFSGKLFTRTFEMESMELYVVGREDNRKCLFPVEVIHLQEETKKKFGLNRYLYSAEISLQKLFADVERDSNVYDVYFKVRFRDVNEPKFIKVGKPRFLARSRTKASYTKVGNRVFAVSPYYTHRNNMLCFQVEDFERKSYKYLRRLMRWSFILRPFYKKKNIWVIGELPYKGQDTGYHFFKYIRTKHPEKNAYYVINHDSPDRDNVEPYGNILYFKSKQHMKMIMFATRIITSHHPYYIYPIRTQKFKQKLFAKKIFLQHGILGAKNMAAFYGKSSQQFESDMILVSSEKEKRIATEDLGYSDEEVAITGLSRFDSLLKNDIKPKRQLLIIPTWREWLLREDIFLESEYLERYRELVYHPKLKELSNIYDFELVFCLHPNMQKFTHVFADSSYRIINQGDVSVQELLKESMMMITDYSSVAFDFSLLEKPIVYYQFDRDRFLGKNGSHIDLDHELPGDIVFEASDVIQKVEDYAENNFKMLEENKYKAATFYRYKDQNACERIFKVVDNVNDKRKRQTPRNKFAEFIIFRKIYNRIRKSKRYLPTMKKLYKIMKTILPINKRLILFESGIGKQYSDSPRQLYEEIVIRDLNYKKVWVYNKKVSFSDPENTIRVKRLSFRYFYYLARARVWVNNQNFPTYLTKRKGTTYVQTWHGTPLKKMLHDIENVMGRNDTYLERVTNSVNRWDYLLSPSSYASETFRSAFQYKGPIIEKGYPRNDVFYKQNIKERSEDIKSRLRLPRDKKVILYAPTFRDNQTSKKNKFMFQVQMDLEKMQQELSDEYIILLRMHLVINNKLSIPKWQKGFVKNVSNYPDMQELLLISDILITDYSSVMFDYANTKRPILYFTYDLETYRDMVRGFYIDFEKEAPGPFVRTTDEIIDSVHNIDRVYNQYKTKYDTFYEKYCMLEDGQATKRVVDYLMKDKVLK